ESGPARNNLTAQARPFFADAAGRLQASVTQIDAQLVTLANPKTDTERADAAALARARTRAQLEVGVNLLNQGIAMPDATPDQIRERATVVNQAKDTLSALGVQDADNPACWQARVWAG